MLVLRHNLKFERGIGVSEKELAWAGGWGLKVEKVDGNVGRGGMRKKSFDQQHELQSRDDEHAEKGTTHTHAQTHTSAIISRHLKRDGAARLNIWVILLIMLERDRACEVKKKKR